MTSISMPMRREIKTKSVKLIHDGAWKELKEDIKCVVKEILNILKDIWNNSAFDPELAKILNEGIYQSTVIIPIIQASLKNLPVRDAFFISTLEKQSIASANRKGEGYMGRHPDIMLVVKYLEIVFEFIYVECSRLISSPQKKTNDEIKLWQETNDRLYWIRQSLKLDKDQFGIVVLCIASISKLNVKELSELLSEVIKSEASESEDVEIFNLWDSESFDLSGSIL
ncbi:12920_t:CDS:2 [Ambispora leptoticha]|uniref:12920_t:CDS:1 n=1 Tax=Ambispora leptoticha TaxID=144679 RepID=A0A9N8VXW7_9GLOM|nr:12920_t:CDS:2 [Ambispora leptoticha]